MVAWIISADRERREISMAERYLSPVLRDFPNIAHHTAPLRGVEAAIYNGLWRPIVDGKLKPGAKLREDIICETFDVSRTLVRKVMVIMEQEGIVQLPPNHGAYVAAPSPDEARNVNEATRLIGLYAVSQLAAPGYLLSNENAERIERHIALQSEAEDNNDFALARILTGEFYILLTHIYGNPILAGQFESLVTRFLLARTLYQADGYHPVRAELHRDILRHIQSNEQEAAVAKVTDVFDSIERSLRFDVGDDEDALRAVLAGDHGAAPRAAKRRS
jgi:DNA-binding GntR family transcriptional regulator